MFKIVVNKECGCFKKSNLQNNQNFTTKDAALIEAIEMAREMNENFCKKHEFVVKEDGENISILVDERHTHGGCCGSGHCS